MVAPINIAQILHEHAASLHKDWHHDRANTVGASEAFACKRRIWYVKNDQPHDDGYEDGYGARARGDLIENHWWLPALQARLPEGVELLFAGEDQQTLTDGWLSATPDGLIVNRRNEAIEIAGRSLAPGACCLVECKSIDPRVDLREAKQEHRGQVQVQLGLVWACTDYKPEFAVITYIDASFLDRVTEFVFDFNETAFAAAQARAQSIMMSEDGQVLRAEGKLAGGRECRYCPFSLTCAQTSSEAVPEGQAELDEKAAATLKVLVTAERTAKAARDEAASRHNERTQTIKEFMASNGTRRYANGAFSVSWSRIKPRHHVDLKAAEAAGIDLSPFMKPGPSSERLTIKETE